MECGWFSTKNFFHFTTIITKNDYITYNAEYKVLICRHHQSAIPADGILRHFRDMHKAIPIASRKAIADYSKTLELATLEEVESVRIHSVGLISCRLAAQVPVGRARSQRSDQRLDDQSAVTWLQIYKGQRLYIGWFHLVINFKKPGTRRCWHGGKIWQLFNSVVDAQLVRCKYRLCKDARSSLKDLKQAANITYNMAWALAFQNSVHIKYGYSKFM